MESSPGRDLNDTLVSSTQTTPAAVKVHCPQCYKLYSVNPTQSQKGPLEFRCPNCSTIFALSVREQLSSEKPLVGERLVKPSQLVKSGELVKPSELVQSDLKSLEKKEPRPRFQSRELSRLWALIREDYENRDRHDRFLEAAKRENRLDECAARYRTILEALPQDEIARQMLDRINAFALVQWKAYELQGVSGVKGAKGKKRALGWFPVIFFLAGFVMTMGLLVEGLRPMLTIGLATLFLSLAARIYRDSH